MSDYDRWLTTPPRNVFCDDPDADCSECGECGACLEQDRREAENAADDRED